MKTHSFIHNPEIRKAYAAELWGARKIYRRNAKYKKTYPKLNIADKGVEKGILWVRNKREEKRIEE